jgi:hypothetical protein
MRSGIIGSVSKVNYKIASFNPTELLKLLPECSDL